MSDPVKRRVSHTHIGANVFRCVNFMYLNVGFDICCHPALPSPACDMCSVKHRSVRVLEPQTRSLTPGPARLSAELQGHSDVVAGVEVGQLLASCNRNRCVLPLFSVAVVL